MATGQDHAPNIADNLARIRERIAAAAERSGRSGGEITLVCVSKTKPADLVGQAITAGATDLGENYVQEAAGKIEEIGHAARWHMIGHLQSNKAQKAAELFDMVQSVDSAKLARRLSSAAAAGGRTLDVLMEVNVAGEQSKTGIAPEQAMELAGEVRCLEGLRLLGVMGIPPILDDPEHVRPYFVRLREIWQEFPAENRKVLSMGMSGDFEAAILEGSTMVRVGTAVFGSR